MQELNIDDNYILGWNNDALVDLAKTNRPDYKEEPVYNKTFCEFLSSSGSMVWMRDEKYFPGKLSDEGLHLSQKICDIPEDSRQIDKFFFILANFPTKWHPWFKEDFLVAYLHAYPRGRYAEKACQYLEKCKKQKLVIKPTIKYIEKEEMDELKEILSTKTDMEALNHLNKYYPKLLQKRKAEALGISIRTLQDKIKKRKNFTLIP
jgi:hypothetical protein